MKVIIFSIAMVAALWGAVTGVTNLLTVDDLKGCQNPNLLDSVCAPADAIVALSGGDTPARVTEAVRLFKAGWADTLVFTGAALDQQGPSNAEAMRRQAVSQGVPDNAILLEVNAFDTVQNAQHTSAPIADAKRIIVVTSPYHQRRAGLEFKKFFGEQVTIVNHPTPYDRLWPEFWWTNTNGWGLALTESAKTIIVMVKL